jgi:hypothetical protein
MASPGSDHLMLATGWMVDVALSYALPWSSELSTVVASMTKVEADDAGGGSSSRWCRQEQHRRWWW